MFSESDKLNISPSSAGGYCAYVPGGGNFYSSLADMISSMFNRYTTITSFCPSLSGIDKQVIKWLCEIVGYTNTTESGGILVSGGTTANYMSVLCSRHIKLIEPENYHKGIVYCSDQTHHSFIRGCYIGGIPKKNIRLLPTSIQTNFEIDLVELESQIQKDLESKVGIPFLLVCNVGTTNTGKIERIDEYIRIAKKYNLWLHADGCYGGCFALIDDLKQKYFQKLGDFDSIAVDPHKGFFVGYGLGAFLIKHWKQEWKTFSFKTDEICYYPSASEYTQDLLNDKLLSDMFEMGIENSRDYKALKLWLPLQIVGVNTYKRYLEEKVALAEYFAEEVKKIEHLEIISKNLTITNFRYVNKNATKTVEEINNMNRELLNNVNSLGKVIISQTYLRDKNFEIMLYVCRVCVLCVRTHKEQIDELVNILKTAVDIITRQYFA